MTSNDLPSFVQDALQEWERLALFAYDSYCRKGRGVVCLEPAPDIGIAVAKYAIFPAGAALPDANTSQLIETYDPNFEMLLTFLQGNGEVRTLRVRTAPGARAPKRVWFFELLRIFQEEPESIPDVVPERFWEMVEKFDAAQKRHDARKSRKE